MAPTPGSYTHVGLRTRASLGFWVVVGLGLAFGLGVWARAPGCARVENAKKRLDARVGRKGKVLLMRPRGVF